MLTIGVIGGGQLARMMQPAAIALGIELRVFAEEANSPAALCATSVGNYLDPEALLAFCEGLDALTFDHEHVPEQLLRTLEAKGINVRPGASALIHAQNKLVMRRKLTELGLPQPVWMAAKSAEEVQEFISQNGPEIIVKTPIGGYDGKGVRVISNASEVADWIEAIADYGSELLLEEKVDFVRELSQLSARNPSGEFKAWALVQTVQSGGVCSEVFAPSGFGDQKLALEIAKSISAGLGVVGVMAVELFETANGQLLVNELAMRPHNSGHFSIEGSTTSQFEQHLRAVLDLPLGDTGLVADFAVMLNLLGVDSVNDFQSAYPAAMKACPNVKFHLYNKAPRKGRKMGHLTILGSDLETALAEANRARNLLYGQVVS